MSSRLKTELIVLAVLVGALLGRIPDTLAIFSNDYKSFDSFVDVQREIVRHYVEEPDPDKMMRGAIEGMIKTLDDPHTNYLPPEELEQFDKNTRGSFSGIGAVISSRDGQLIVVSPLEDSPAYEAGIKAGDAILEVDGKSTEGETTTQAVKRITGPEGSQVELKIRHENGVEKVVSVTRRTIQIQTVKGFRRNAEHHWDYWLNAEKGIAYINLTQFSGNTSDMLRKAIGEINEGSKLKGLILDLRFNPGGLLSQATEISDMFLDKGVIVSTEGRTSPKEVAEADPATVGDFPIVILVNQYSASASEIVSGALKDNQRATIVGTRTFGKGSVQQVRGLAGGNGAIKVTTAYYYLPSGRSLHRRTESEVWGVDPTDGFYVPMSGEQIEKMQEARQASDVINADDGNKAPAITPEWLRDTRFDPQLAAALEAMGTRLETGKFKPLGADNATLQSHLSERKNLEQRRERFQEGLDELNKKLKELDDKIAKISGDPNAKAPEETPKADGDKKPEEPKP